MIFLFKLFYAFLMAFMPKLFEQEFRFCPFKVHVKA